MGVPAEGVVAVVLEPVAAQIEGLKDRAERLEWSRRPRPLRRYEEVSRRAGAW